MKPFYLDLKVISICLAYVTIGWGMPDGQKLGTGSVDVEAKSNEPLSEWNLV